MYGVGELATRVLLLGLSWGLEVLSDRHGS